MRYYGNVILHLQQYSHRLNLFFLLDQFILNLSTLVINWLTFYTSLLVSFDNSLCCVCTVGAIKCSLSNWPCEIESAYQ